MPRPWGSGAWRWDRPLARPPREWARGADITSRDAQGETRYRRVDPLCDGYVARFDGHLDYAHGTIVRLGRCHLKGREGGATNVILAAVGYNLHRVLAWLRTLLRLILLALSPAFVPVPAVSGRPKRVSGQNAVQFRLERVKAVWDSRFGLAPPTDVVPALLLSARGHRKRGGICDLEHCNLSIARFHQKAPSVRTELLCTT
jgi:hypothetical protein